MAEQVTDNDFKDLINNASTPVLVDFWAEWCGPCKMIAPILDQLSNDMEGKLVVVKMNVDENPETPSKLGVRGIPSLMLFNNGALVDSKVGVVQLDSLKEWIKASVA